MNSEMRHQLLRDEMKRSEEREKEYQKYLEGEGRNTLPGCLLAIGKAKAEFKKAFLEMFIHDVIWVKKIIWNLWRR